MLRAGQVIEKYTVEAVLGSGASAEVYRVRHEQLRSTHALKILSEIADTGKDRLLEEGRVQASLRHPNLVGVTDVLQHEGHPALVMEYVNGPSLRDWLDQGGLPAPRVAIELTLGIARGMRHAHERGLVHRDLKPANILLEVSPQGMVPRILDFGLVKQIAAPSGPGNVGAVGTPAYMSPEQIRDPSAVDERTDLFALGGILYEMLHGTPPFEGADPLEVVQNIQSGRRRPISENLSPALQALLDRLLTHDADSRITTAAALVAELQEPELLRTEQIQAHPADALVSQDLPAPATPPRLLRRWACGPCSRRPSGRACSERSSYWPCPQRARPSGRPPFP